MEFLSSFYMGSIDNLDSSRVDYRFYVLQKYGLYHIFQN